MNGIVIVDKPQDWTSQDVTARLRRVFQTRRIGHGGTLDPMATGVLPVFVGRGTRGVEFFEHAKKTYETVLQLGITTDTEDISGEVLERRDVHISETEFAEILSQFRGKIMQIPPMYSALKVNGQKVLDNHMHIGNLNGSAIHVCNHTLYSDFLRRCSRHSKQSKYYI